MVIADQIMPGMKGVELLEEVHRRSPQTVKILLTGQAGLDAVVDAINRAGLNQYIPKPWDEPDLRLTIENLLSRFRLERERDELLRELQAKNAELATLNSSLEEKVAERTRELGEANTRLAELAITDGLTGLYNHRHFRERLSLEVERSNRTGLPLSVLMIDVDHFKGYNDRHGHLAGDKPCAASPRSCSMAGAPTTSSPATAARSSRSSWSTSASAAARRSPSGSARRWPSSRSSSAARSRAAG